MEIIEIISYQLNHISDTIKVEFRSNEDDVIESRQDIIALKEADDFGFELLIEDFDFFEEDQESDFDMDEIDESQLISFLNEYYMIYPDRLPKKD
jgi:hypothetical protein